MGHNYIEKFEILSVVVDEYIVKKRSTYFRRRARHTLVMRAWKLVRVFPLET